MMNTVEEKIAYRNKLMEAIDAYAKDGMSNTEIAKRLGVAESTVRYFRAQMI